MDLGTGLTLLGSGIGAFKVVEKLLGPSAEYLGEKLKKSLENIEESKKEKKIINQMKILERSGELIGSEIDEEKKVNIRVLKRILEEGAYSEDDVQINYFGGLLASSRTEVDRDDRAVYYLDLLSRLSSYHIRSHYIIYSTLKHLFNGEEIDKTKVSEINKLSIFIPFLSYQKAMEFNEKEVKEFPILSLDVFSILSNEQLIDRYTIGTKDFLKSTGGIIVDHDGICVYPTLKGLNLFLWAFGKNDLRYESFFKKEVEFNYIQEVNTPLAYKPK